MKGYLLTILLLMAGTVEAGELEHDQLSAPRYPRSLYESGVSGLVTYELNAHSNGSISDVRIVDSSEVKFARSVVQAIPKWRFKAWQVTAEMPTIIRVRENLYFTHPKEGRGLHGWVRQRVRWASCAKFNKALAAFQTHSPDLEPMDMHYVTYTIKVLARSATRQKMTDEQRTELGEAFVAAIPGVIAACQEQPDRRYRDVLPERVRVMLWGGGQSRWCSINEEIQQYHR